MKLEVFYVIANRNQSEKLALPMNIDEAIDIQRGGPRIAVFLYLVTRLEEYQSVITAKLWSASASVEEQQLVEWWRFLWALNKKLRGCRSNGLAEDIKCNGVFRCSS